MHGRAVVPDQHVAGGPLVGIDKLRLQGAGDQVLEQVLGRFRVHADDVLALRPAEIERLGAVVRVGAHQRLDDRIGLALGLGEAGMGRLVACRAALEDIGGLHVADAGLDLGGQGLIAGAHVDHFRIAAAIGNGDAIERGELRRDAVVGMVGVPAFAAIEPLAVLILVLVADLVEQRITVDGEIRVLLRHRFAETAGGGEELGRLESLVAEDDRYVFDDGSVQGIARRGVERLAEVDAGDLGADVFLEFGDLHGHGSGHGSLAAFPAAARL